MFKPSKIGFEMSGGGLTPLSSAVDRAFLPKDFGVYIWPALDAAIEHSHVD